MGVVLFDALEQRVIQSQTFRFDRLEAGKKPGEIPLHKRLYLATESLTSLFRAHPIFEVGIEEQIGRYNVRSLIETSYLVGHIQRLSDTSGARWYMVKPSQAKQALATTGTADKPQMVAMAAAYGVAQEGRKADREAIADALGVALAAEYVIRGRILAERAV
jgi:Holliday junction resolvasome RuvABC endonuclease subunit